MIWDHPINDSLWINTLTLLLIAFMWVAFMSVVIIASCALGRGLRWAVDAINAWYVRHPV